MATPEEIKAAERYDARLPIYVAPEVARRMAAQAHAVSYAQAALNAALLLNGGALVAYPAFIDSADISIIVRFSAWSLIIPLMFHIVGLVMAIAAYFCAFVVMTRQMRIAELSEKQKVDFLKVIRKSEADPTLSLQSMFDGLVEEHRPLRANMVRYDRQAVRTENTGIWLFAGSGLCFACGAGFGLWMLSIAGPLHIPDIF